MKVKKIGPATLILADYKDVSPAEIKADAIITDPPYGVLGGTETTWDTESPEDVFSGFLPWALEAEREGGACNWIVFGKLKSLFPLLDLIRTTPVEFKYELVWSKGKSAHPFGKNVKPLSSHELIAVLRRRGVHSVYHANRVVTGLGAYVKKLCPTGVDKCGRSFHVSRQAGKVYRNGASCPDSTRLPLSVLSFRSEVHNRAKARTHPTAKPVELMRWLVRSYTDEKMLVLDPFMGGGSTGAACVLEGRRFVGVERRPEYFDIACENVERAFRHPEPVAFLDWMRGGGADEGACDVGL